MLVWSETAPATRLEIVKSLLDGMVMENFISLRLNLPHFFKQNDTVEIASERPDAHEQVERAALYAKHGYFHSSFTQLLFPFVPEIPLE